MNSASTRTWLRAQAVGWSLRESPTLAGAIGDMEFVQADPIRAPARAQDLILRHRVAGYRVGDLDRDYARLNIDEDLLYAYGFTARRLRALLHPRIDPSQQGGRYVPSGLAAEVAAFVAERGPTHPREVQAHFGARPARGAWGGRAMATTRVLELLHHYGVLRVAKRENGIRVYEPAPPIDTPLDPGDRLRELTLRIIRTLAPLPEPRFSAATATLGELARAVNGPAGRRRVVRDLLASGQLEAVEVDGVRYLWPADLRPVEEEPPAAVRFLAPFDPVVWDRSRFEHLWSWAYRFEAYTPASRRALGYYAMPLLWRDTVIGWANCTRGPSGISVDVGFADARPRQRRFSSALDAEVERLAAFLAPRDRDVDGSPAAIRIVRR
jgi:uncharacterized protein